MRTVSPLRRILITAAAAAGAVFALAPAVSADSTTESFQISPPTANYAANPGTTVNGTIKVTNLTGSPMTVNVGKQNFVAKGEEGEIELTDNADPLYSLAPWFSFDASQLNVPPRGTVPLHYTISVPANAEPGGRYGSIVFSTIPPKLPGGTSGAAVEQTLGGIVFLRINGPAKEQLNVASFQSGIYNPASKAFTAKNFFEYGPVDLLTRIQNTGTVHEKPTGTITIKNIFGSTVGIVALDQHFVIPGAVRRLHNTWPASGQHQFLFGPYTAHLAANYGSGKTLTADTNFTVLPWKLLLVVLIIVILLILFFWKGRKRFARAGRILAGRE